MTFGSEKPPTRNTSVLIDMENLFGGYSGSVTGVPIRQILEEISLVTRSLEIHSKRAVTRAYANWSDSRLATYRLEMMENGVEPVQVFSFNAAVKNAADIELVVDAMSLAMESPWIEVFVIVSGDGGFVPLVRRLHALGKFVVVVTSSMETTNKLLIAAADHFHLVGSGIASGDRRSPRDAEPEVDLPPREVIEERIREIVREKPELLTEDGTVLNNAHVAAQLTREHPGFLASRYGTRFGELANHALGRRVIDLGAYGSSGLQASTLTSHEPEEAVASLGHTKLQTLFPDDAPTTRAELKGLMAKIISSDVVRTTIDCQILDGTSSLGRLRTIISEVAPSYDNASAGFPTFKLAMRYGLAGTPYCLVPGNTELMVARRDETEFPLSDIEEENLGRVEIVREVLARCKPSLLFNYPYAIVPVVSCFVDRADLIGKFAELLETVCQELSELPAEHVRLSLGLLAASKLLSGDEDTEYSQRMFGLNPHIKTQGDALDWLQDAVMESLSSFNLPIADGTFDELVPHDLVRDS